MPELEDGDWFTILTKIEKTVTRIETRLNDHIDNHRDSRDRLRTFAAAISPLVAAIAVIISLLK